MNAVPGNIDNMKIIDATILGNVLVSLACIVKSNFSFGTSSWFSWQYAWTIVLILIIECQV